MGENVSTTTEILVIIISPIRPTLKKSQTTVSLPHETNEHTQYKEVRRPLRSVKHLQVPQVPQQCQLQGSNQTAKPPCPPKGTNSTGHTLVIILHRE